MVDIHCHLLPGVDDGPADEATAIAMARLAAANGTTDVVATPHANETFTFSPEINREKLRRLQEALGAQPRLHLGCDFHLTFDNVAAALAERTRFTINGGPYLLVEFSDRVISAGTSDVFARMHLGGLTPIITHPERNPLLRGQHQRLAVWVHRGCLIQITAGSLLGGFGAAARGEAIALVNRRLAHVVASDGHDLDRRSPVLHEARAFVTDRWGEQTARRLFVENPGAVIRGETIAVPPLKLHRKKQWWMFWK
jgi:protein-tyrosine phosphatase